MVVQLIRTTFEQSKFFDNFHHQLKALNDESLCCNFPSTNLQFSQSKAIGLEFLLKEDSLLTIKPVSILFVLNGGEKALYV